MGGKKLLRLSRFEKCESIGEARTTKGGKKREKDGGRGEVLPKKLTLREGRNNYKANEK